MQQHRPSPLHSVCVLCCFTAIPAVAAPEDCTVRLIPCAFNVHGRSLPLIFCGAQALLSFVSQTGGDAVGPRRPFRFSFLSRHVPTLRVRRPCPAVFKRSESMEHYSSILIYWSVTVYEMVSPFPPPPPLFFSLFPFLLLACLLACSRS